jgi:hypothetical protein
MRVASQWISALPAPDFPVIAAIVQKKKGAAQAQLLF